VLGCYSKFKHSSYARRKKLSSQQPTSFRLDTYQLETVFQSPDLVTSLTQFTDATQMDQKIMEGKSAPIYNPISSVLFLRVQAAADYYTMNQTLMQEVPPVYVDIILDPFIMNIVPRSLIPTAAYIIVLAIGSWFLAKSVNRWIQLFSRDKTEIQKKLS